MRLERPAVLDTYRRRPVQDPTGLAVTAGAVAASRSRRRSSPRLALALVVGIGLTLAACTEAPSSSSSETTERAASGWARVDRAVSELGPEVGLLAARVSPEGTCRPVHEVASSTPRAMASQFKLFVLGALVNQIAAGRISWDQTLTVQEATKSVGNAEGSLQYATPGTLVTVEEAATKMISISDNTAADMLIELVGRNEVEAQVRQWTANAAANEPFLTTRQVVLLHYVEGLADRYVATPRDQREAFLASSVDPLPLSDIASGLTQEPRFIDTVEWFASAADVCRGFAGLQILSKDPALSPLSTVLSREVGGIGLDQSDWPTVWYKGGSEPGVLTLGWLATNSDGETFVVQAMVSNPDAALSPDSIAELVALAEEAFGLLGSGGGLGDAAGDRGD